LVQKSSDYARDYFYFGAKNIYAYMDRAVLQKQKTSKPVRQSAHMKQAAYSLQHTAYSNLQMPFQFFHAALVSVETNHDGRTLVVLQRILLFVSKHALI